MHCLLRDWWTSCQLERHFAMCSTTRRNQLFDCWLRLSEQVPSFHSNISSCPLRPLFCMHFPPPPSLRIKLHARLMHTFFSLFSHTNEINANTKRLLHWCLRVQLANQLISNQSLGDIRFFACDALLVFRKWQKVCSVGTWLCVKPACDHLSFCCFRWIFNFLTAIFLCSTLALHLSFKNDLKKRNFMRVLVFKRFSIDLRFFGCTAGLPACRGSWRTTTKDHFGPN